VGDRVDQHRPNLAVPPQNDLTDTTDSVTPEPGELIARTCRRHREEVDVAVGVLHACAETAAEEQRPYGRIALQAVRDRMYCRDLVHWSSQLSATRQSVLKSGSKTVIGPSSLSMAAG